MRDTVEQVRRWGDPCLGVKCQESGEVNTPERRKQLRILKQELVYIMHRNKGIGLAAPQVGLDERIFVMAFNSKLRAPILAINPTIEVLNAYQIGELEGCLSLPGAQSIVNRAWKVKLNYTDEHGRNLSTVLTGLDARCAQHELDHLDGILFIDKIDKADKDSLLDHYYARA